MPLDSVLSDRDFRLAAARYAEAGQAGPVAGHICKNSLNGGEISPLMGARFDQQRFQSGCHELLNMVPLPCGGISKRPGFEHARLLLGAGGLDLDLRLVPFIFSANESRMLVLKREGDRVRLLVFRPDENEPCHACDLGAGWFDHKDGIDFRDISFCQSADTVFMAHRELPPAKICRHADTDWRFEVISWLPAMAAPQIVAIRAVGSIPSGENSRQTLKYVATAIDGQSGEESLPCAVMAIDNVAPLSQTYYMELRLQPVPGASEYRVYKLRGGVYGYTGRIEAVEGQEPVFEDRNIQPDVEDTPPNAKNPFDAEGRYPALVFLHQQRLGFAASLARPLTIWLSQAGNFESMAASVPPADDDAIECTLAAAQANRILWCESDRSGLALGTEGGEWLLRGGDGGAITPSSVSFEPQTFHGSQPGLPALRCGSSLLFMQRGGMAAREFGYSFQSDRYEAMDLSILARHILERNPVQSWCWQPEPYGIVWCALRDGSMAGLTFMREHDVIAWHRHEMSNAQVAQLAAIPAASGQWQVWAIVRRPDQGGDASDWFSLRRTLERMRPFFTGGDPAKAGHTDGQFNDTFRARCAPCLPEYSGQDGASLQRVRKINAVKARVVNAAPFKAQVTGQGMPDGEIMDIPARGAAFASAADWACPLASGWRDNPRLNLIFDGPLPATVLGLTITLELASESGGQGV